MRSFIPGVGARPADRSAERNLIDESGHNGALTGRTA